MKLHILSIISISILVVSCIPHKEIIYLQDERPLDDSTLITEITGKYKLRPNDYLYIHISTFDPKISQFFNVSMGNNASMANNTGNTMFYYMIDDNFDIDYPYVGKINLRGCNIAQAKEKITKAIKPFVKDASVKVRLGSNSFTILGEVKSPGLKRMAKDQITIFEAIGLAGDLTVYGKRKKVQLVRSTPEGKYKKYIVDLTNEDIIASDYYYIYPNDLIYIRPMRAKQFGFGESISLRIFSSILSITLTIVTLTKL